MHSVLEINLLFHEYIQSVSVVFKQYRNGNRTKISSIFLGPSCRRRNVSSVFLLHVTLYTCIREIDFRISSETTTSTIEVFVVVGTRPGTRYP